MRLFSSTRVRVNQLCFKLKDGWNCTHKWRQSHAHVYPLIIQHKCASLELWEMIQEHGKPWSLWPSFRHKALRTKWWILYCYFTESSVLVLTLFNQMKLKLVAPIVFYPNYCLQSNSSMRTCTRSSAWEPLSTTLWWPSYWFSPDFLREVFSRYFRNSLNQLWRPMGGLSDTVC